MQHEEFGAWLRRQRRALALSQAELGARLGCSAALIRKIESGERRASQQFAEGVAGWLSIAGSEHADFVQQARLGRAPTESPDCPGAAALPLPLTPFIGRQAELQQTERMLARPDCRLLNLVGPGGSGKTRLALELARRRRAAAVEVIFLPLAAAEEIGPVLARALCISSHNQDPWEQALQLLAARQALLLFDNLEHLADVARPLLVELLQRAPQICLLITSRERLYLPGEWVFELQGLPFSADAEMLTGAAFDLFMQAAQRARPDFRPHAPDLAAIGRICRLVDGLPLAIELAAGWVRLLSCNEIAAEIEHSLDLLSQGPPAGSERHASMRAVCAQSWDLLLPEEQRILRQLAIFRGRFTRTAAEQVARAGIIHLRRLLDGSLILREGSYFMLHSVIRLFAGEQLQAGGESTLMETRRFDYVRRLAAEYGPQLQSTAVAQALESLDVERDTIRAAVEWGLRAQPRLTAALVLDLWSYCYNRLSALELAGWYEQMLASSDGPADELYCWMLLRAGQINGELGRRQLAAQMLDESLNLTRQAGRRLELATTLIVRGWLDVTSANLAGAKAYLREGLALSEAYGFTRLQLNAQFHLAGILVSCNELAQAETMYSECCTIARATGNLHTLTRALKELAMLSAGRNEIATAITLGRESLELMPQLGNRTIAAWTIHRMAIVVLSMGRHREAVLLLAGSERLFEDWGDPGRPQRSELHEYVLRAAQSFLGPVDFAAAWQSGRLLQLPDLVALARQTLEQP
jgi:predicted ATPase